MWERTSIYRWISLSILFLSAAVESGGNALLISSEEALMQITGYDELGHRNNIGLMSTRSRLVLLLSVSVFA